MISNLRPSLLSFKANEWHDARKSYNAQLDKNKETAQKQNGIVANMSSPKMNKQIPLQGAGRKLDIIA